MELMQLWISKRLKMDGIIATIYLLSLLILTIILSNWLYSCVYILIILCVSFFRADWELYGRLDQFLVARAASAVAQKVREQGTVASYVETT